MSSCLKTSSHPFDWSELPTGAALLQSPTYNKGTAFSNTERDTLGLHGLLPHHVSTQDEQVERVMENFHSKLTNMGKYIFVPIRLPQEVVK